MQEVKEYIAVVMLKEPQPDDKKEFTLYVNARDEAAAKQAAKQEFIAITGLPEYAIEEIAVKESEETGR